MLFNENSIINNEHINNLQNILRNINERIEGNLICDITPDNYIINRFINKIINIQNLALNKKKICEIGINACHSLLLMIMSNPDAEYLLFDLNNHKYTEPCLNYIKKSFPNTKITTIFGNSVETIYKYINDNSIELAQYDLCHIDGGHTIDIFSHDYENIKKLSSINGIIIFDDYDYPEIRDYLNDKLNKNEIIQNNNVINTRLHLVYSYNHN